MPIGVDISKKTIDYKTLNERIHLIKKIDCN